MEGRTSTKTGILNVDDRAKLNVEIGLPPFRGDEYLGEGCLMNVNLVLHLSYQPF
jgi:hypothetical protein